VAHSSTDVPPARWFRRHYDVEEKREKGKLERAREITAGDWPEPPPRSVRESQQSQQR
jgi:hypothetical protein